MAAAAAAGGHTQLGLQIAQRTGAGGNGFLNLAVGDRIADADKHHVLLLLSNWNESKYYLFVRI